MPDNYDGLRDLQRRQHAKRRPAAAEGPAAPAAQRLASLAVSRRRHWPRRLLVLLNVAIAVVLIGGASAFAYAEYRLGQVDRVAVPGLAAAKSGPFTVLIIGSDTRDLSGSGNGQFGTAADTPGQRSDTIMLARVVPSQRRLTILSIPRDLWETNIPGFGAAKINSAFDTGPAVLIKVIEQDLGIPINHFIEVNFDSFRDITNAVGGVKVWFPTPAKDPYSLLDVSKAGCVLLKGNQALAFARSRHYTYYEDGQWIEQGLSDLARIQRQQFFVKKMLKKAESEFTNPIALNRVIGGVTKNLIVDKGFSSTQMIGLAEDFHDADINGIPTETLPTNNYFVDGQDALALAEPQARQMVHAFNTDGDATDSTATTAAPASTPPTTSAPAAPVAVQVANGSGVNGQAATAAAELSKAGYQTSVQTEGAGTGRATTKIVYAPDSRADALRLQARLKGSSTLVESPALTPTPYNLEVITGADWAGIGKAQATKPAAPAASQVHVANYPLPGPAPTEAQLASC